ncbi:hypothetical protein AL509_18975 [Achromobacter xylosoxidans]|uniref:hypothetical protein n=1 Tax=Alcaligenes xylosoxydans xylosoxydans TaxID=85698 RepID=UPI00076B151A|nr:hypothetical protein [Achromobacter xylosoxidans]AMH06212.1 hypothetical protein AL509_18975 [Achromobacter xylosoxidans]
MLSHILSPNPARRAAPAPAFINLTFYASPAVLALIRKRLYEALRQRAETVADVRYSVDGEQACTAISLRSDSGNPWPVFTWLSDLCREMGVQTLRVGVAPAPVPH